MGQVTITLNGRTYRMRCGDGEEPRLLELAEYVRQRIDALAVEFGQVGDDRLLLMGLLLITDELWDMRSRLAEVAPPPSVPPPGRTPGAETMSPSPSRDDGGRRLLRRPTARSLSEELAAAHAAGKSEGS